jgi:hypothetical protein
LDVAPEPSGARLNEEDAFMGAESIEKRIALIEDKLAIYSILSAFAPVVDGGGEREAAEFFDVDGEYVVDVPGAPPARGRAAVLKIYESAMHRDAVRQGIAHMLGFPHVAIDGDNAQAITYACIFRRGDNGWYVSRIASNSFDFVRREDGWKISKRVSRELSSEQAREVFSRARLDLPWLGRAGVQMEES